jgi:hypothetical protein
MWFIILLNTPQFLQNTEEKDASMDFGLFYIQDIEKYTSIG